MRSIVFGRTVRVRWVSAFIATAFVSLGAAQSANADDTPLISNGVVTMKTGSVDRFEWTKSSTYETISTKSACTLVTSSTALMKVGSVGVGVPGFNFDSIGLYNGGSGGVPCSRVSADEGALVLQLGTALSGSVVTSTHLDIEAKKNVVVQADLYLDPSSATPSSTYYLVTGKSKTDPNFQNLPNADYSCASASDSGPDSGASDNCGWNISGRWVKMTLKAQIGEFGLEGGADGTAPSTFTVSIIADGVLGCDSAGGANVIHEVSNEAGLGSSGIRLDNVADPKDTSNQPGYVPTCVNVPYAYSTTCPAGATGTTCTNFVYDPLSGGQAQGTHMAFYFKWVWPPETIPASTSSTSSIDGITETMQFFLNNSTAYRLDLCPEIRPIFEDVNLTPDDPSDDVFTGIDPAFPPTDQDAGTPGTQAGCLITRQVIQEGAKAQVIEGAYVQGDYGASRQL